MSAPFRDDSWDAPEREPDHSVIADDDLVSVLPYYMAVCQGCGVSTLHGGFCDEHGCEVGSGCLTCRRIERFRECRYSKKVHSAACNAA